MPAEQEILRIRLTELRKKMGLQKEDLSGGTSKLEKRNDFKRSALLEYLEQLGMGIEIKVYPKNDVATSQSEMILLKLSLQICTGNIACAE